MNIREAIKAIVKDLFRPSMLTIEVTDVDKGQRVLSGRPLRRGAEVLDVLIKPVKGGQNSSHFVFPKVGTTAIIGMLDDNDGRWCLLQVEEIDELHIYTDGNFSMIVASNGDLTFNGGHNNGLVKVQELTQQLNAIENWGNALVSAFNAHFHLDAATLLPTLPPAPPFPTTLVPTQQSAIENTKIKH